MARPTLALRRLKREPCRGRCSAPQESVLVSLETPPLWQFSSHLSWSKPIKERFLLRSVFVVGDQPIFTNLLEPLQFPFERGIWVSGRRRSRHVATLYRVSAQGELLIGEG